VLKQIFHIVTLLDKNKFNLKVLCKLIFKIKNSFGQKTVTKGSENESQIR